MPRERLIPALLIDLKRLLLRNNVIDGSWLYLDSPGGNLFEGMKLGRVIRKHSLFTTVGKINPKPKGDVLPAHCLSACTLAFLGGEFRFWKDGSIFGVHR